MVQIMYNIFLFYLKTTLIFLTLNTFAVICCINKIAENGWFEIEELEEGIDAYVIILGSIFPVVRLFFLFGIITMAYISANVYYEDEQEDEQEDEDEDD